MSLPQGFASSSSDSDDSRLKRSDWNRTMDFVIGISRRWRVAPFHNAHFRHSWQQQNDTMSRTRLNGLSAVPVALLDSLGRRLIDKQIPISARHSAGNMTLNP